MCGVIGYVGRRAAKEQLLRGLERLEYRGYDSAGLCLVGSRDLDLVKAVGKLENLKLKAGGVASRSTAGIGHTRWATHGPVSEENAPPLMAGGPPDGAVLVHRHLGEQAPDKKAPPAAGRHLFSGNHAEIKKALLADGEHFCSETDAEVVAHLVRRGYAGDVVEAVRGAYAQLEGHFAFIAVHRDHPDLLVGTRNQCPLIAGIGEGETFLAS